MRLHESAMIGIHGALCAGIGISIGKRDTRVGRLNYKGLGVSIRIDEHTTPYT